MKTMGNTLKENFLEGYVNEKYVRDMLRGFELGFSMKETNAVIKIWRDDKIKFDCGKYDPD